MSLIKWQDNFSVGICEIDTQHQKLIKMVNDFYDGIKSGQKKALGNLLNALLEYAAFHFSTEEKYMDKFGYTLRATHKKEHERFTEKTMDAKRRFDDGRLVLSLEITQFLKEWIKDHMLNTDKKYSKCFFENGLR